MQMNLSTRELRAFVTLAAQRSFTRAAAMCHLSQPAFSALIQGLEQTLGARLFDRTTRSVELAPAGELFLDAAHRLLRDAEAALIDIRDHSQRRRGRVALAVLPSLAAGWLPPLLAEYHRRHPAIALEVADVLSDVCLDRVRSGQADFALAASRSATPELRTDAFCTDSFYVVCPRAHPLASRRASLKPEQVLPFPIVQLARSSSVRQHVDAAVHPLQFTSMMELDQLSTVAGMVRAGLGITIVPSLTLFHFNDPGLVARPLAAPGLERQVFMVRRADRSLSSAAQGLHDLLMAARPAGAAARRKARRS
jgi:LysR family transcriptional regulator, carnitine catabolism transcriptional activator